MYKRILVRNGISCDTISKMTFLTLPKKILRRASPEPTGDNGRQRETTGDRPTGDSTKYTQNQRETRKINRDLTFQLSPTVVHYNLVELENEINDNYAIGIGGRQKLTRRVSLNAEYFYQLNDKLNNNVLSLGFDVETGGHVFQLHLSNSPAMIESEFITKTTGSWLNGDVYFGFNISRVFVFNK